MNSETREGQTMGVLLHPVPYQLLPINSCDLSLSALGVSWSCCYPQPFLLSLVSRPIL